MKDGLKYKLKNQSVATEVVTDILGVWYQMYPDSSATKTPISHTYLKFELFKSPYCTITSLFMMAPSTPSCKI